MEKNVGELVISRRIQIKMLKSIIQKSPMKLRRLQWKTTNESWCENLEWNTGVWNWQKGGKSLKGSSGEMRCHPYNL